MSYGDNLKSVLNELTINKLKKLHPGNLQWYIGCVSAGGAIASYSNRLISINKLD